MKRITISAGDVVMEAELNESPTAVKVWDALPIDGRASTWGDEIYFEIPVSAGQEPDARADVAVGGLGYWPVGSAFCIFFGQTPVSKNEKPRAYSPVNIFGRITGDAGLLRNIKSGSDIQVRKDEV